MKEIRGCDELRFHIAAYSDIGIEKAINEDSVLVQQIQTGSGEFVFALVCDGMGGLSNGDRASREVINAFGHWTSEQLPRLTDSPFKSEELFQQWEQVASSVHVQLRKYGMRRKQRLGTTAVAVLLTQNAVYTLNVGDSRVYCISDTVKQLTEDQSLVALEVAAGNLTAEEAEHHPKNNILLQSVGSSEKMVPAFDVFSIRPNQCYLLCTDGFRHELLTSELLKALAPEQQVSEDEMEQRLIRLISTVIKRGETDNISAILIKTESIHDNADASAEQSIEPKQVQNRNTTTDMDKQRFSLPVFSQHRKKDRQFRIVRTTLLGAAAENGSSNKNRRK